MPFSCGYARARAKSATARARTGMEKVEACGRAYMAYAQEFPHFFDACARLESQAPHGAEPKPQAETCVECGKRVHDVARNTLSAAFNG